MLHSRIAVAAFVALTVGMSSGCGGGGGTRYSVTTTPIVFTSTALPATLSGEVVSVPLQFSGGFGGPYITAVLSGAMPPGTSIDNATTAIVGRPLAAGTFNFVLQLTDSGGLPFATTTANFQWDIGVGPLVFVTDSALPSVLFGAFTAIPITVAGGTPPYSCVVVDDPARPPLLPADEQPPLGMSVPTGSTSLLGTPLSAKTGNLPYYITIEAHDQTSAPIRKLFSIAVLIPALVITTNTLSSGVCGTNYTDRVDLVDGIGPFRNLISEALNDPIQCTGEPGSPLTLPPDGPGGTVPLLPGKGFAPCAYAADSDVGPNYGSSSMPVGSRLPEGIYMKEGTGDLIGTPHRKGTFTFAYYVYSRTLPADPTQNKWRAFTIGMAAPPPGFALDPSITTGGSFVSPNNKLPDLEIGVNYNPDGGAAGLQFKAIGGIPQDGRWDSPHDSQGQIPLIAKAGETAGSFAWSSPTPNPTPGVTFTGAGVLTGTPTLGGGYQNFTATASDSLLPSPLVSTASATVQFAVGPDTVIITESASASGTAGYIDATYDNNSQTVEIYQQFSSGTAVVRYPSDGNITGNINTAPSDMAVAQTNPSPSDNGNNGGRSFLYPTLTAVDILRVGIIPTNRYNDVHGLSTQGPRAGQHCDRDARFPQEAIGANVWQKFSGSQTALQEGGDMTSDSCIDLPELSAASIANMPTAPAPLTNGIYANGGQMYGFDNANCFGFFIVRKDSKFYLPCVFNKPAAASPFSTSIPAGNIANFNGFGDGWVTSTQTASSRLRMPCITVSPNGRFAAVKLKQTINNSTETANNSKICIFSLCGEKVFDDGTTANTRTYKVISTGGSGGLSDGRILYGDTLTLTDRHLYWLQGNYIGYDTATGGYSPNVINVDHWVYRYEYTPRGGVVAGATGGLLNPGASTVWTTAFTATGWTNNTLGGSIANNTYPGNLGALSTTYHRFSGPGTSSSYNYTTYQPNRGASGVYVGDSVNVPACSYFGYNWGNTFETSMAPTPFRVSADGLACAIVAGPNNINPNSAYVNNFRYFIFVDECNLAASSATYGAATNFRNTQASNLVVPVNSSTAGTARRFGGAQRVGGLYCGEELTQNYGWFHGPATQLEIADDHSSLAAVYNDSNSAGASSPTLGAFANTSGASYWVQYRENIVCFKATGTAPNLWNANPTEIPVTGSLISGSGTNVFSAASSTIWRFGCLAYTRDNAAFVFWGGASGYFSNSASSSYIDPGQMTGTLYAYDITGASAKSILAVADGGNENGIASYTTSSPCNPTSMSSWNGPYFGVIEPTGAFYSNDGNFFYVVNYAALNHTSTDGTSQRLFGVNVKYRTGSAINGRAALTGFQHSSFNGLFRGFGPTAYAYPGLLTKGCIGNTGQRGGSDQVSCAGTNGLTFFTTQYQNYNAGNAYKYITTGDLGGGPVYNRAWSYYDCYGGEVFGFDSSVGGEPFRLSTLGGTLNDTTYRRVTYVQPDRTGSRLAMSVNTTTLTYWGHDGNNERPYMISNIATNAVTGALSSTPTMVALESANGRLGPSMAMDSTGLKFYYAFGSTGGSEAGMVLTEKTFSPAGAVTATKTSNGYAGTTARFAILWSGR